MRLVTATASRARAISLALAALLASSAAAAQSVEVTLSGTAKATCIFADISFGPHGELVAQCTNVLPPPQPTPSVSQRTVTLSGTSSNTCILTRISVGPNAELVAHCADGQPPPPPPPPPPPQSGPAVFSVFGPTTLGANTTNATDYRFARIDSTGPAESIGVGYTIQGPGCNAASAPPAPLLKGESRPISVSTTGGGACSIELLIPAGHLGAPASLAISVGETPGAAVFSVSGPTVFPATTTTTTDFRVTRTDTNGPASAVLVGYTVSGGGCSFAQMGPFALTKGQAREIAVTTTAGGTCAINLILFDGSLGSPSSLTFTVSGSNGGPGDPGVNCPAPAPGTKMRLLEFDDPPDRLMLASGQIAAYPVKTAPEGNVVASSFTQGQGTQTPGHVVGEMSISRCPGVIDTSVPQCYLRMVFDNFNLINMITKNTLWSTEAQYKAQGGKLCWAAGGDYYVNVRWTYPFCPFGEGNCGYTMQWGRTNP